jgi:hypothetical protein
MTDRRSRVVHVREALALRDAVLRYLSAARDERADEALIGATPVAWSLFLRFECCALSLVGRLRADGLVARAGADVQRCLSSAEAAELQRVLAARLLVRELDAIGERAGLRFTVLKGGALAADPARKPVDLGDVDAIATHAPAEHAWRALLSNGWSPIPTGLSPTDALGEREHFAPLRSTRHELPLELHARFDYGLPRAEAERAAETTPIPGYRSIDRLVGPRVVVAVLRHSVVVHPHRRGHLRDLFLLGELLQELDEDQLNAIDRELRLEPQSAELLAMLTQAKALSRGEPSADSEALRRFVWFKYAAGLGTTRLLGTRSEGWNTWSHVPLERPAVRRAEYRRLLQQGSAEPIARDWSPLRHRLLASAVARSVGLPRLVRVLRRAGLVLGLVAAGGVIRRHVASLMKPKGVD